MLHGVNFDSVSLRIICFYKCGENVGKVKRICIFAEN